MSGFPFALTHVSLSGLCATQRVHGSLLHDISMGSDADTRCAQSIMQVASLGLRLDMKRLRSIHGISNSIANKSPTWMRNLIDVRAVPIAIAVHRISVRRELGTQNFRACGLVSSTNPCQKKIGRALLGVDVAENVAAATYTGEGGLLAPETQPLLSGDRVLESSRLGGVLSIRRTSDIARRAKDTAQAQFSEDQISSQDKQKR